MSDDTAKPSRVLRDADVLLEGLRLGRVGVWRWKVGTDVVEWTENLESVHRLPPGAFDGTLASFRNDLHPDDAEAVWRAIRHSLETGKPYYVRYRAAPRAGRDAPWLEANG